jgi:hypothetical protein
MKYQHLIYAFAIIVASSLVYSCKKDRVPAVIVDPNCTDTISFATQILPMMEANCTSCHGAGNSTGYTLTDYSNISTNAAAILNSIQPNASNLMPQGAPALNDSLIQQFSCWKFQGTLNN